MFYRRKSYVVINEFVEKFNAHFNQTNLPNQLSHGTRLVGRWMLAHNDHTTEIFAIWEYDSYEDYVEIENKIKADQNHIKKVNQWYEENGGRERVYSEYIVEVKNESLVSTTNLGI